MARLYRFASFLAAFARRQRCSSPATWLLRSFTAPGRWVLGGHRLDQNAKVRLTASAISRRWVLALFQRFRRLVAVHLTPSACVHALAPINTFTLSLFS